MAEVITEFATGLLVLGLAALWVPVGWRVRLIPQIRKDLDKAQKEIAELRGDDDESLA